MYKGKLKCQGCGRDGAERARASRLLLCPECQQLLLLGVAVTERSKARLIVTADGDVYCGGQKCMIINEPDARCQDCALSKIGTNNETNKDKYMVEISPLSEVRDDLFNELFLQAVVGIADHMDKINSDESEYTIDTDKFTFTLSAKRNNNN